MQGYIKSKVQLVGTVRLNGGGKPQAKELFAGRSDVLYKGTTMAQCGKITEIKEAD